MRLFITLAGIFLFFTGHARQKDLSNTINIPIYFDISYFRSGTDSLSVTITGENGMPVARHTVKSKTLTSLRAATITNAETYSIHILVKGDTTHLEFSELFTVGANEESIRFDISVTGRNTPPILTAIRYYPNQFNVSFQRLWDPQRQFNNKDRFLLPQYDVRNRYDSVIYGIKYRENSKAERWIELHPAGFIRWQKWQNGNWEFIDCNAPRIDMALGKDSTGHTLPEDTDRNCEKTNFKKGGRYRVCFEYGINNWTRHEVKQEGRIPHHYYIEQKVYCVYDEVKFR
jgi:hypothetical protein